MSVGSIINQATGKIYDDLVPQGGGIPLAKGQIITALAGGTEIAFPNAPPADGSVLSYDSNEPTGLRYIANPAGIPLDYQQLISANAGNATAIVPAPAHNNYVLTSDTDPANTTGLAWKPLAGPSGTITTIAPLQDLEPVAGTNELSIAFTAVKGEIPAGNGTAKTGALVPAPTQDKYVLTSDATTATGLKWSPPTGAGGIIDATAPLVDDAGVGVNTISINFSASVGEIPYGNGTAKTGAFTNVPTAGQILGISGGVPAWVNAGGSGTITGTFPIVETAGGTNESVISIGFGASVGQLPYGNGTANTGALTNVPTAGQILGISGGVPAWVNAGGSGTITGTFPIVETAGGTNESVISIGFANKGELACGAGGATAGAGVILPPPTADDYVLSSFASAPSGMRWVAPTTTQKIIRSATATTVVPDPETTQDTLIMVAEDPQGSWDLQEDPTDPETPITPYAIDAQSEGQVVCNTVNCFCVAEPVVVNNQRAVRIWVITNTDQIPVGILYQTSTYSSPTTVFGIQNPLPAPSTALLQNSFIVYGSFLNFHYDGDNPPPDVACYGIAVIDCSQLAGGIIEVKPLADLAGNIGNDIRGVVNNNGNNFDVVVYKLLFEPTNNNLYIFGYFDAFANGTQGTIVAGWNSIAVYNSVSSGYLLANQTQLLGLGVSIDGATFQGSVVDAYFTDANNLFVVGFWDYTWKTDGTWTAVPTGMTGLARWVAGSGGLNPWSSTPTIAGGLQSGSCIRPSVAQANSLLLCGSQPNTPIYWNTTTNTLTATTGAIPASPQSGRYNSIACNSNIDIGFGAGAYDFVEYQDSGSGDLYVIWFSNATAFVAQPLTPSPTNLKPFYQSFPTPVQGTPYTGFCNYGMRIIGALPAIPYYIDVMATGGKYKYDPSIHANLDFTGNFYYNGALKNTARFSTATQGNESQSFVASTSLKSWIQIGAKTSGLTYLP